MKKKCKICGADFETRIPKRQLLCGNAGCAIKNIEAVQEEKKLRTKLDLLEHYSRIMKFSPDTQSRYTWLFFKLNRANKCGSAEGLAQALAFFITRQEGYDVGIRFGNLKSQTWLLRDDRAIRRELSAKNLDLERKTLDNSDSVIGEREIDKLKAKIKNLDSKTVAEANRILVGLADVKTGNALKAAAVYFACKINMIEARQTDCADAFNVSEVTLRNMVSEFIEPKYGAEALEKWNKNIKKFGNSSGTNNLFHRKKNRSAIFLTREKKANELVKGLMEEQNDS